jgi:hypothetical protein
LMSNGVRWQPTLRGGTRGGICRNREIKIAVKIVT